jgi:chromate transporter
MTTTLNNLFWHFMLLSLLAVGGASSTLSDLHAYLVTQNAWMTDKQFVALYTLSQIAPGPNVQFVALFGWQVAGLLGAGVSLLGMCGPSSLLAVSFEVLAKKYQHARWPFIIKRGLTPLSIGLLFANGWILAKAADLSWLLLGLTIATASLSTFTRLPPLLLICFGAIIGYLGYKI